MERAWPAEALDFEASVRGALQRAGDVDLARACEADPALRRSVVGPMLAGLGIDELDVGGELPEAAGAALAAKAAGAVACPWPLVQRLAVPVALRHAIDGVYLCDGPPRRAEHGDLFERPAALDIRSGALRRLQPVGELDRMPLDPFGVDCELGEELAVAADGVAERSAVLGGFWVLGALSAARRLASEHARDRQQFGKPIAAFGAIQWHLSDIGVACDGLAELAAYSLLRLSEGRLTGADALALRLASQESTQTVLTAAHQILAAIGLCEEHDLTVIDRHVQPLVRRPCSLPATIGLLADAIAREGFDALYPIPAAAVPAGGAP